VKLGISSWAYPWTVGVPGCPPPEPMRALDLLARASEQGVEVVQFADNMPLHAMDPGARRSLAAAAREQGIDVEVGTVGLEPDYLDRYLAIAGEMGSSIVRVVIDTPQRQPSVEEIVATLRQVLPGYARQGVRLLIENHDRFPAAELAYILRKVDRPEVGICLDTVNSLGSLETVETVLAALRPWVMNVHVKDFRIRRAHHKMGFLVEGTAAGAGRLDIPWLLGQAKALPHDSNVILELWPPFENDVAFTVEKEQAWVGESVDYLRRTLEHV